MFRLVLIGFVLLLSIAGCAANAPGDALPSGPQEAGLTGDTALPPPGAQLISEEFPSPADLGRSASSFQKLLGSQVYKMRNAWVEHHSLFLQAPILPEGGEPKDESPPKVPSAASNRFAYGTFVFGGIDLDVATLEFDTGYNHSTRFWVALGNWETNSWDFSLGSFFANPTIDISDPEEFGQFIDDNGRIAVAVIADDPSEVIQINSIEVTLLSEVTSLKANNFRWDGVELTWDAISSTNGFRVLRRRADDATGPWTLANQVPLLKYDRSFVDTQSLPGVEYTYAVQSGFLRTPGGTPRWYWSPGVMVNGIRQVSEINVDTGSLGRHIPFLVGNRLGFFSQRSLDLSRLDGVRNREYTPGTEWDEIDSSEGGFTPFSLYNAPGHMLPLLTHQSEQVNNPVCSLIYSTLDGTFAQVCDQQEDDSLLWHDPVQVRGADTVIVALVNMPRRYGAVVYNEANGLLELVDSVDFNGRIWYEFEPETYPWMTIGEYRPDGRVSVDEHEVDPQLCFRDANSGEMKFLEFSYSGWLDNSPDAFECSPGPIMTTSSAPLGLPETVVFYITPDRSELRSLTRDIYGTWHPEDTELVVAAGEGGQLQDFVMFTSGSISFESYLVYSIDGVVYAMRSISTSFANWSEPAKIDDSGTCRDLRIIKVGSNAQWESHHYASYIKDSPEGGKLISFRDLFEATKLEQ